MEYPNWDLPDDLSELLAERFEVMEVEQGYDYFEVATTQQSKVGGYPGWTQPPSVAHLTVAWPGSRGTAQSTSPA
ncbi:hypothetical protein [Streptomyces shenzhenensis]|uniref:hypothetical protein n=1 Tax=Streptomyces shenzhenensis TaxID=943815 RepID=UPI001F220557|nr:hypothetical protein [Streptomyces shenzhenensis]